MSQCGLNRPGGGGGEGRVGEGAGIFSLYHANSFDSVTL